MKKSFGEWLLEYKGDPAVEDLRDDYNSDYSVNFKRRNEPHIKTPELMMWHISMQGACKEAKDTLKEAAILYGEPLVGWEDE